MQNHFSAFQLHGARVRVRRRGVLAISVLASALLATPMMAFAQPASSTSQAGAMEFDLPASALADALTRFGIQSGMQVTFSGDAVAGLESNPVKGRFTPMQALDGLLKGKALEYEHLNALTVLVKPAAGARTPAPPPRRAPPPQAKSADEDEPITELQRLAVTGTRIKGAELTSPLVMITSEDMRISGQTSLGDALRVLPQNFSGGQNPGVVNASGVSNQNATGGSSFNLRGLGPDATLTLLNGSRLAYDSFIQGIDVDSIPVAAVDRVEVLLDGASSIYGSDAVGGVVNVILKRDYTGAEVSARLGTATSGGFTQSQYTGVAGTAWSSGGLIFTANVSRNTSADAGQRDYLAGMHPDHDIYPDIDQKSAVFSGHQQFGELAELAIDGFYSDRDASLHDFFQDGMSVWDRGATSWGMHPSVSFSLRKDMSLRLHAAFGRSKSRSGRDTFSLSTGEKTGDFGERYDNKNTVVGLEFSGAFARFPAGSVGYSLGGGYRESTFAMDYSVGGRIVDAESNESTYAYGEIDVPLIADHHDIPLVRQLSINGAVRYEKYNSFGETTTPKIGVFWGVSPSLDIKASWGRSFKAPTLLQQYQPRFFIYEPSWVYQGGPEEGAVLLPWGGNPDLGPEEATVVTAGLVFRPEFVNGLSVELNWFDIDYSSRVVQPHRNVGSALVDPASEDYRIINPSLEEINREFESIGFVPGDILVNVGNPDFSPRPWNPDDVYAIVNNRYVNAAGSKIRGIDFSIRHAMDFSGGILTLAGNGNWITDSTRTINALAPELSNAGLIFTPAKFKGRVAAVWSRDTFTVSTAVNHIDGISNDLFVPSAKGKSMTTVDLVLDYWVDSERLGELGINFGVINLLNQRPPYAQRLQSFEAPYDSTNYSALGRVVNLTLTKRF